MILAQPSVRHLQTKVHIRVDRHVVVPVPYYKSQVSWVLILVRPEIGVVTDVSGRNRMSTVMNIIKK